MGYFIMLLQETLRGESLAPDKSRLAIFSVGSGHQPKPSLRLYPCFSCRVVFAVLLQCRIAYLWIITLVICAKILNSIHIL